MCGMVPVFIIIVCLVTNEVIIIHLGEDMWTVVYNKLFVISCIVSMFESHHQEEFVIW